MTIKKQILSTYEIAMIFLSQTPMKIIAIDMFLLKKNYLHMKNLLVLLLTISLVSCGTPKTVRASKKVIKGEWTLNKISYSSVGTFNISLLNDESKECFEGSAWQFIPNNNTGTYTINGADCSTGMRHFVFIIKEIDEQTGLYNFMLKPTDKKGNSETNQGIRFKLIELTETTMQWQQTITKDGKPFIININFTK